MWYLEQAPPYLGHDFQEETNETDSKVWELSLLNLTSNYEGETIRDSNIQVNPVASNLERLENSKPRNRMEGH